VKNATTQSGLFGASHKLSDMLGAILRIYTKDVAELNGCGGGDAEDIQSIHVNERVAVDRGHRERFVDDKSREGLLKDAVLPQIAFLSAEVRNLSLDSEHLRFRRHIHDVTDMNDS
jgi:hypothetical protein